MDSLKSYPEIRIFIPCKIVSEANNRDHWRVKNRRKNIICLCIQGALNTVSAFPIPAVVTFERSGKRMLDDDNLAFCFKGARDIVSKMMIESICEAKEDLSRPRGYHDSDPRLSWRYTQSKGDPGFWIDIKKRVD
jgi:hypothetical protein